MRAAAQACIQDLQPDIGSSNGGGDGAGKFCLRFGNHSRWTTILTKLCIMQASDEARCAKCSYSNRI